MSFWEWSGIFLLVYTLSYVFFSRGTAAAVEMSSGITIGVLGAVFYGIWWRLTIAAMTTLSIYMIVNG